MAVAFVEISEVLVAIAAALSDTSVAFALAVMAVAFVEMSEALVAIAAALSDTSVASALRLTRC